MYDLTVKVTDRCNFECNYCIFSNPDGKSADLDFSAFYSFLEHFGQNVKNVVFSGGEPFLRFKEISEVIEKTSSNHKHIDFHIMTNGSLLNKKVARFIEMFKVNVIVSIDGCKKDHDLNRTLKDSGIGTYDMILNNLGCLKTPFSIVLTVHPTNCRNLFHNFQEVMALNPSQVLFSPVIDADWSEDDINVMRLQLKKMVLFYKEFIKKKNIRLSILDLVGQLDNTNLKKATCFEKCGEHLYLDADGSLYVCGSCVFSESLKKEGFITNVLKGNLDSLGEKLASISRLGIMPCLNLKGNVIENQSKIVSCFVDAANLLLASLENDPAAFERTKDILVGGYWNEKKALSRQGTPKKMFIYVTNKCNLKCDYCYLKQGNQSISLESCKKAIELLFESNGDDKYLRFMGGEPLIEWDLVRESIDYARILEAKYRKGIKIEVATNGILINDKITRHLEKKNVHLHVSIDGEEFSHNLNRKSPKGNQYKTIVNNIKGLLKRNINLKCNLVVSPNTCEDLLRNIKHIISMGIKHISFEPAVGNYWAEGDLVKLDRSLKSLSRYYQNYLIKRGIYLDCFEDLKLFPYLMENKLFNRFFSFGCESHLTVNSSGEIVNCPCYPDETDPKYLAGSTKNDSLEELKDKKIINQIYFQDKNTSIFCNEKCLSMLTGPNKTQRKSQSLHRLAVIEPRFYHYRYMINYKSFLFNSTAKKKGFSPSKLYLDVMPHFTEEKGERKFIKDNSIISLGDLEIIDLNKEISIKNIKDKSGGPNAIYKGYMPLCKIKENHKNEIKILKQNLVPYSCLGCQYFFEIKDDKVVLCSGESFAREKFDVYSALMLLRKKLKARKECEGCNYYGKGMCFGYCRFYAAPPEKGQEYDLTRHALPEYLSGSKKIATPFFKLRQPKIISEWKNYFAENQKRPLSLYVHIPFCANRCGFCHCINFTKDKKDERFANYLECLQKEIDQFRETIGACKFDSMFIGGGSPNILSDEELEKLLKHIFSLAKFRKNHQNSIELTPNLFRKETINVLKKYPINRVSMGVQSLDKEVLRRNNRPQNEESIKEAIALIKKSGKILNVDLMVGLAGETDKSVLQTAQIISSCKPDTVQYYIYDLLIKNASSRNREPLERLKAAIRRIRLAEKCFDLYNHDESINVFFRKREHLNKYDLDWIKRNSSILGFGFGAKSHIFGKINYNISKFEQYTSALLSGREIVYNVYPLQLRDEQMQEEYGNPKMGMPLKTYNKIFEDEQK